MRKTDWMASVWTIALGLVFLTVAAAGLSRPIWLSERVVDTIVSLAPIGCVLGLIGLGMALTAPDAPKRRKHPE